MDLKKLKEKLKDRISDIYEITSISKCETKDNYRISYVELQHDYNGLPVFISRYENLNLKAEMRSFLIDELLTSEVEEETDFDVEDVIYSDEEKKKLQKLRASDNVIAKGVNYKSNNSSIRKAKIEWSEQFSVGDRVNYQHRHGIITFKHQKKSDKHIQKWSIKCGDTECRYVSGILLSKRKVEDLSHVKIDPSLNKLSTERLLKKYRFSMKKNKGRGDIRIKRILNERENLNTKITKVIIK